MAPIFRPPAALRYFAALILTASTAAAGNATLVIRATRVVDEPIVREDMLAGDLGVSINGPSLIRVPAWVKNPLGKYYLYFAHHAGKYIRLAYADRIEGPWKILDGGVQRIEDQTALASHVASPEAIVDEQSRQIYLYFHGMPAQKAPQEDPVDNEGSSGGQRTSVSVSSDGIHFKAFNTVVGPAYLQVFRHDGQWFALTDSGYLRRCDRLGEPFKIVGRIIGPDIADAMDPARLGEPGAAPAEGRPKTGPNRYAIRHIGVDVQGDRLLVYFSCVGHRPERILCTTVEMKGAPETWKAQGAIEVLRPERKWEGADLPLAFSLGGISRTRVNELRDPAVFRDGDNAWLLYTVAGEHGVGLARLSCD